MAPVYIANVRVSVHPDYLTSIIFAMVDDARPDIRIQLGPKRGFSLGKSALFYLKSVETIEAWWKGSSTSSLDDAFVPPNRLPAFMALN